jgi:hypothetical protein
LAPVVIRAASGRRPRGCEDGARRRINRGAAATALGLLGDRDAVPALVAALKDDGEIVRGSAITALGRLGAC